MRPIALALENLRADPPGGDDPMRVQMNRAISQPNGPAEQHSWKSLSGLCELWKQRLQQARHIYWPDMDPTATVTIKRRVARRHGAYIARGSVQTDRARESFCIKWFPGADEEAICQTEARLNWWRARHAVLGDRVPRIIAAWPHERVLVMTWCDGLPVGRYLRRSFPWVAGRTSERIDRCGTALGEWLRTFSAGGPPYDVDVQPLLGKLATRDAQGRLAVDAHRLLTNRIEQGHRAARTLVQAGVQSARSWCDRFDLPEIERSFGHHESAGFVHGDVKPDNMLISGNDFFLIDWWRTPRVSWPLTDVANLAGNLYLHGNSPRARRFWESFVEAYFGKPPDDRTRNTIELIASILRLVYVAERIERRKFLSLLGRKHRRLASEVVTRRQSFRLCT